MSARRGRWGDEAHPAPPAGRHRRRARRRRPDLRRGRAHGREPCAADRNRDRRHPRERGGRRGRPHPPDTALPEVGHIPDGASPQYHCFVIGQAVAGTAIWFSVTYDGTTGFYSSAFDDARFASESDITRKYGIPRCDPVPVNPPPPTRVNAGSVASGPDWAAMWRITKCAAVLTTYYVIAARLVKALGRASSVGELARLLVNGALTPETVAAVAEGILGVQDVIDNCRPPT